ncbi:MAG: hypothetical protein QOK86_05245 [Nitrososphaeraceae archaeon]|jgi:hypothetical protein|nr:hypothetical protein [Nitrososphaeraceae archaeon]
MRIPNKEDDDFGKKLNGFFDEIQDAYLQGIRPSLTTTEINVMLQDGSVTKSTTFDPQSVIGFYRSFLRDLKNWNVGDIQETTGELNRTYCQILANLDNYTIKGYFGIQFNVLPYYKPDKQVIQIQKELLDLSAKNSTSLESVANIGNNTIKQELKNMSLDDLEFGDLFERLLQNQELIGKLEDKIKSVEKLYPELDGAEKKKNSLIYELDNLIMKVYQISPNLIDYNRLMQGEEGLIVYFDIETKVNAKSKNISNKSVNFGRMKLPAKKRISELFKEIIVALNNQRR